MQQRHREGRVVRAPSLFAAVEIDVRDPVPHVHQLGARQRGILAGRCEAVQQRVHALRATVDLDEGDAGLEDERRRVHQQRHGLCGRRIHRLPLAWALRFAGGGRLLVSTVRLLRRRRSGCGCGCLPPFGEPALVEEVDMPQVHDAALGGVEDVKLHVLWIGRTGDTRAEPFDVDVVGVGCFSGAANDGPGDDDQVPQRFCGGRQAVELVVRHRVRRPAQPLAQLGRGADARESRSVLQ
mmetsp:Transcript_26546/g.82033  ORF Transcript_26546/g.82033 Transcript_26546/m.82033 type:complete len:239 (+) Transcript_26546:1001-1717(+)